jgi:hypothetical protein
VAVMMLAAAVMWAVAMRRELVIAVASYWPARCHDDDAPMSPVTSNVKGADSSLGYAPSHQSTTHNTITEY